ncbi:C4-dicarboxylate ABC transporter permease [Geosporobacter ferrireducens]|uniref:C4-dicarboxylate ABC transporter permease n=2 Tax=Geosporobacter ferrireducens TaxID=1424294 RepID=A0A1D8GQ90_9FIRM|nr:C4-dicarboxylate ABC transporter permease [Geosporobacter ferrireducens]MTI57153.1 tripartite tricarboxylate transporter permease [Geosporobacter ferrireducens]
MNIFLPLLDINLLLLIAAGTFAGIYIGAIPGLSVTMAVSLLISFTFSWDTHSALALMVGIYTGGVYGGSRSSILLNIPGAPAAIATSFDGYPLAKLGEAGKAIGISTVESVLGGFIGIAALALGAPFVSEFALKFAPRDYLLLAIMGLMLVGSLGSKSTPKGLFMAAFGILLGLVGMDPLTGQGRFTFGSLNLMGGINYVTAMIGLFGVSEALVQIKTKDLPVVKQKIEKIIPSWETLLRFLPLSIRTSILGVVVGALPGTGGDLAALLAYDHAKRTVKNPTRPFGEGALEGLVAPESANNAAIGGAFIPMLTLGIPGDAVTAIIIGALFIHGLKPGPMLMVESPNLFWLIVGSLILANFFLLVFGLTGVKIFTKLVEIRKGILIPMIIILSVVGSYTINNNIFDIYWMLAFGVLGYIMKTYDFPVGPLVLGLILGPMLDTNYRRSVMSAGSIPEFFLDVLQNPISLFLFVAIVVMIFAQSKVGNAIMNKEKKSKNLAEETVITE